MTETAQTPQHSNSMPKKQGFKEDCKKLIAAKYSIVAVPTYEDERCIQSLRELAQHGFGQNLEFYTWSITNGLVSNQGEKVPGSEDPVHAIDYIIKSKKAGIYAFKDLQKQLNPKTIRKLRDAYQELKSYYKTIFLLASETQIPADLVKEVSVLDFELPSAEELERLFEGALRNTKNAKIELSEQDKDDFVKSALGLTWDEAYHAFVRALAGRSVINRSALSVVIEEKCKIVRKEGILDYVPVDFGMQEIGGLETLKKWLSARSQFFSKEAVSFGLRAPKGVLLTGISGCGKSSCVKAISQYWRLPLMRLDMTKVYGGTAGNPEETMRRALKTVEAVAPVILWLEEIEKGVAGFNQGDGGVTARIFSSFLTWMQEKKSLVFVAATANEINQLPPELLRKGRFDEIFFVDLPTEQERTEIFKVHIQKRKHNPEKFKLVDLAKATVGFSGAEIEQIVAGGMFESFNQKRQFNDQDLYREISKTVPLSTTMAEQIKEIKRWADTRAVKAS
ncbi:MAG: AAA family ATPase [Bdellovibrionales bacterium]|nr:AAA family ATPase [Bdellovibrionales bacterium]